MPLGKKNCPKAPYTKRKLLLPLHCVALYICAFKYLSNCFYTFPLFLPTAIFIAIIFINPYTLAPSASPLHATEARGMSDFSTASAEDQTEQHTQHSHRVWPACSPRGYGWIAAGTIQQARRILFLQMITDTLLYGDRFWLRF